MKGKDCCILSSLIILILYNNHNFKALCFLKGIHMLYKSLIIAVMKNYLSVVE